MMACSRPPVPATRIFTPPAYRARSRRERRIAGRDVAPVGPAPAGLGARLKGLGPSLKGRGASLKA